MELSEIARHLALLPDDVRLILICDTCNAAAITQTLLGAQRVIALGSCGDDQTMLDRTSSEFMVRLQHFVCSDRAQGSLEDLRKVLEAETPDCERPFVWTNVERRYCGM